MAKRGAMPRSFAAVHPIRRTPIRAIVATTGIAAAFAGLGDFAIIAAVTDFAVYVVFLAVNATVITCAGLTRKSHDRSPLAGRSAAFRFCPSWGSRRWRS